MVVLCGRLRSADRSLMMIFTHQQQKPHASVVCKECCVCVCCLFSVCVCVCVRREEGEIIVTTIQGKNQRTTSKRHFSAIICDLSGQ